MDAFKTVINLVKSECEKHNRCDECMFSSVCEELDCFPYEILEKMSSIYNTKKQKKQIDNLSN